MQKQVFENCLSLKFAKRKGNQTFYRVRLGRRKALEIQKYEETRKYLIECTLVVLSKFTMKEHGPKEKDPEKNWLLLKNLTAFL